eukprot:3610100-Pleurochrysis_carterae.AAC.1
MTRGLHHASSAVPPSHPAADCLTSILRAPRPEPVSTALSCALDLEPGWSVAQFALSHTQAIHEQAG